MQGGRDAKCLWIAETLLSGSGYHLYVFAFEQTALEKFHFFLVTIPFMFFCYHFFPVLSEQSQHQEPPIPLCPSSHSHLPVLFPHRAHSPASVINMGPSDWLRVPHKTPLCTTLPVLKSMHSSRGGFYELLEIICDILYGCVNGKGRVHIFSSVSSRGIGHQE